MDTRAISQKISYARAIAIREHPFFSQLLLKLKPGLSKCGTAFTDMRRIVFDPEFADRLSIEEIKIVLLHEVLHCALKHCIRANGKHPYIYNAACDIVVNSIILEMYNKSEIIIDGSPLMNLAPDGLQGREYTAEKIYEMLMKLSLKQFDDMYGGGSIDSHDGWKDLDSVTLEDLWNHHLKEAASASQRYGIPNFLERQLKEIDHLPRVNWRQILHDFILFDKSDYDFARPDKRFSSDVILPSFCENIDGSKVDNLWFLVDTSSSVSDDAIAVAYEEIKQATSQIGNLTGMLSFFDHAVSDPIPFETLDDILEIKPIGGGGTSFRAIFRKLAEYAEIDKKPNAIIIMTDGYDLFPSEEMSLGVPVIWIIVDSDVVPPWGTYAYVTA